MERISKKSGFGLIAIIIVVAAIAIVGGGGLYLNEMRQLKSQPQSGLETKKQNSETKVPPEPQANDVEQKISSPKTEMTIQRIPENWEVHSDTYGMLKYEFRLPPAKWEVQSFENFGKYYSDKIYGLHILIQPAYKDLTLEQSIDEVDKATKKGIGYLPKIVSKNNTEFGGYKSIQREQFSNMPNKISRDIKTFVIIKDYFMIISIGNIQDFDPDPNIFRGNENISEADRILFNQILSSFSFGKLTEAQDIKEIKKIVTTFFSYIQGKNADAILRLFTLPQTSSEIKTHSDLSGKNTDSKKLFNENAYRLDGWNITLNLSDHTELIKQEGGKYIVTVDEERSNWHAESRSYQKNMGILMTKLEIINVNGSLMIDKYYPVYFAEEPFEKKYAGFSRW